MSDIYAEFGVNNAVITSTNITEHEENMLALPTNVRDGDAQIITFEEGAEGEYIPSGEEQEQVQEGDQETPEDDQAGDPSAANEGTDEEGEFQALGDPSDELVKASQQISEYADGFAQMRDQAIKAGLPADVAARIEAEYENDNELSEASLEALEEVGYGRGFVKAYIQGQEALANSYVGQIQAYAGGPEKFQAIVAHMSSHSPKAVEALENAITNQDLATVQTLINLGIASHSKKFGKAPARSVTRRAPAVPAQGTSKGAVGFESQREMIAAMSDKRYSSDAKYRQSVEAKVAASRF